VRKHDEESAEQQLIGDRIHVLPKGRSLAKPSSQQTIQTIRKPGNKKERKRDRIVIVQDLDDEKRENEQSQQSKQIGCSSKLGEKGHGR
jgi:hypothetical protein